MLRVAITASTRGGAGILVGGILAVGTLGGCVRGSGNSGCSQATRESLDPTSAVHLLPGAAEPAYRTDPPTSGAHRLGVLPRGVVDSPLPRPTQVALLEKGAVVIQYQAGTPALATRVGALADHDLLVTIAPNPQLSAPVIATAWTWKLTCRATDDRALTKFIKAHQGHGPESR